jgi:hypothetical protein
MSGPISETARTTAKLGVESFYIPTHRDVAAMDGAPDLLWWVKKIRATAKANAGPPSSTKDDNFAGGQGCFSVGLFRSWG